MDLSWTPCSLQDQGYVSPRHHGGPPGKGGFPTATRPVAAAAPLRCGQAQGPQGPVFARPWRTRPTAVACPRAAREGHDAGLGSPAGRGRLPGGEVHGHAGRACRPRRQRPSAGGPAEGPCWGVWGAPLPGESDTSLRGEHYLHGPRPLGVIVTVTSFHSARLGGGTGEGVLTAC